MGEQECRVCRKHIDMMCMKNTGFCCLRHQQAWESGTDPMVYAARMLDHWESRLGG